MFVYLKSPDDGGETYFPNLNKKIKPVEGTAILWTNCDSNKQIYDESLHAGLPVKKGCKIGMNLWFTDTKYDKHPYNN